MTLTEFESELQAMCKQFAMTQAEGMRDDPDNWPSEYDEEEWWEQFLEYAAA